MLPSDPTAQVAAIGILTTFITTIGVVAVAILNNRKERGDAADAGVEKTLRERILLRDEKIDELNEDVADLKSRLADEIEGNELKSAVIERQQADLARLQQENSELRGRCQ